MTDTQRRIRDLESRLESEQIEVDILNGLLCRIGQALDTGKPFQKTVRQVREIMSAVPDAGAAT